MISSPGASAVSRSGSVAGQAVKVVERRCSRRPCGPATSTTASRAASGTQKSDGWVAMQASLQPRMAWVAVLAAAGVAAGAGVAPVAGAGGVLEIGAAGALHQVAADGRGVAQLRRGARQQRLGDQREGGCEGAVVGEVGVADQRADPRAAVGQSLDAVEAGQAA